MKNDLRRRLGVAIIMASLAPGLSNTPALAAAGTEAGPGGPAWFELYHKALVHSELEEWDSVEEYARQAIELNPRSQRTVRIYGMWHSSYIPYYFLGLAEYRQGRYDDALKSFRKEEEAGVIRHDPVEWLKMQKLIGSARPAPPPGAAAKPVGMSTAPPAIGSTGGGPDPVIAGLEAFFKGRYDESIAAFQEAMKAGRDDDLTLHLYLGMAYAGKASGDSGQRQIWENLAFMEFRRVHVMDPGYRLSPGVFSEEMMALFERSGQE